MCISTSPRNYAASSMGPRTNAGVDIAQMLRQASVKPVLEDTRAANSNSSNNSKNNTRQHYTVIHNYHDHASDARADYQEEHPARGGVTTPFPLKLHDMLLTTQAEGMDDIVSWQPHGRCFLVHKPKEFVELLPRFFKLSKLPSFQRQLNLYGFQRLTRGRDRGGYYHELFLRDRVFLSHAIQRIKVKGTGVRARSNPAQEPNFWSMPWVSPAAEEQLNEDKQGLMSPLPLKQQTQGAPMPLQQFLHNQLDEDILLAFGNKTFHYLDPFAEEAQVQPQMVKTMSMAPVQPVPSSSYLDAMPTSMMSQPQAQQQPSSLSLLNQEADAFFQDFDFPEDLGPEIEDDAVFGSLLEELIS